MSDYDFIALWTEVLYDTAISVHPQHSQPIEYSNGWVQCTPDVSSSRIWIPAERRSLTLGATAGTESRLVIGGSNGAMTMIALSQ
jgi:hypothetical protein